MQPPYNPYAAPAAPPAASYYNAPPAYGAAPFWMNVNGQKCTFAKDVVFPGVCMKCGAGEPLLRKKKQYIFVPFYGRLFGLIGYYLTRKTATLDVPICGACNAQRMKAIWILVASWAAPLVGILAMIVGAAVDVDAVAGIGLALFFAGFIAPLVVWLAYAMKRFLPGAVHIDANTITLVRIGPQAVAHLGHYAQQAQSAPAQGWGQPAYPQQPQPVAGAAWP